MKRFVALAIFAAAGLTMNTWAVPVTNLTLTVDPSLPPTNNTAHVLGAINPDNPASPDSEVIYINGILGLSLGGTGTVGSDTIYRSKNDFGSLPTVTGLNSVGGTSTTFTDTGYTYLAVKYDGPNGATEVYYLGDVLAGTQITIPANAFGKDNTKYGLSGWNFFNEITETNTNPPPPGVPDGGSTVALLGVALAGFGVMRRKLQK